MFSRAAPFMSRVVAIVEGRTEQAFCGQILVPTLGAKGVYLEAQLVGKPGHKGGVRSWESVRRDILNAIKQQAGRVCTTMFDYYGLPGDWPGVRKGKKRTFRLGVEVVERSMHEEICGELGSGFDEKRFLPYVQLHEFETLLFSGPKELSAVLGTPSLDRKLREIVEKSGEPEAIDDNPNSAPSKRISALAPHFQKVLHGTIAAQRIGIDTLRGACPHFASWLAKLEALR